MASHVGSARKTTKGKATLVNLNALVPVSGFVCCFCCCCLGYCIMCVCPLHIRLRGSWTNLNHAQQLNPIGTSRCTTTGTTTTLSKELHLRKIDGFLRSLYTQDCRCMFTLSKTRVNPVPGRNLEDLHVHHEDDVTLHDHSNVGGTSTVFRTVSATHLSLHSNGRQQPREQRLHLWNLNGLQHSLHCGHLSLRRN